MPLDRWETVEVTPGWTIRDHVAHLADWAEEGVRAIEVYRRERRWLADPDEGMDAWNERHGRALRGRSDPWPRSPGTSGPRGRCSTRSRRSRLRSCGRPTAGAGPTTACYGHVRKHLALLGPWCAAASWPDPVGLMPETDRGRRTTGLTIEAIVAVDPPREFRIHPRDRVVAYTAEVGGARQLFTMPLRGGAPTQLTASEKAVGDPQWSPDGRRLAFIRDDELWVVEADGSRSTRVVAKPGGAKTGRWSPDGRRLAFLSRRRGWSQVWLIDAPGAAPRPAGEQPEAAGGDRPHRRRASTSTTSSGRRTGPASRSWRAAGRTTSRPPRSRWSTSPRARRRSSPARPASTPARAGCPTGPCSTSRMPTAGSRSSG